MGTSIKPPHAALLLALCLTLAVAEVRAEDAPQEKLNRVHRELGQVQSWLKDARSQQSSLLETLRKTETEIGRLAAEAARLKAEIRASERHEKNLSREHARLRDEVDTQKQHLHQQIRASHMSGQQEYLKLLLNQSRPEVVLRMLKYYEYFHRARLQRIRDYHQQLSKLEATRSELRATTARLGQQRQQLTARLDSLRSSREARLDAVQELESRIRERDARHQQLTRDRDQLDALIQAMRHAIPDMPAPSSGSPFAGRRGKLPWPTAGKLASADSRLHENGIFIRAAAGRTVRAIHHGQIVFADWMRRFGLLVIVDHGDGYMSLYAHNRTLLKQAGEWVRAGEPIAQVGDSGGQGDSGLYFEIRHKGQPQNPRKWCQALG